MFIADLRGSLIWRERARLPVSNGTSSLDRRAVSFVIRVTALRVAFCIPALARFQSLGSQIILIMPYFPMYAITPTCPKASDRKSVLTIGRVAEIGDGRLIWSSTSSVSVWWGM
jgi:hypothetical protein